MAHRRRLTVLLTTIVVLLGLCTWWNHRWSVLTHVRVSPNHHRNNFFTRKQWRMAVTSEYGHQS